MALNRIISRQSETSPLLPKPHDAAHAFDTAVGIAPKGANAGEGGDVERQGSFKHQGLPEVRKRMKYIFPAIAIGVSK
jgi:hypothetical protein